MGTTTVRPAGEFGKDHGLIHEAVVTGRKVGAGREFWGRLAESENYFRFVREWCEPFHSVWDMKFIPPGATMLDDFDVVADNFLPLFGDVLLHGNTIQLGDASYKGFPVSGTVVLLNFPGKVVGTKEVLRSISMRGLNPGTVFETLYLRQVCDFSPKGGVIVGLGTQAEDESSTFVPAIVHGRRGRWTATSQIKVSLFSDDHFFAATPA